MLHRFTEYDDIDVRKLMDIYRESNTQNTDYFYPEITDKKSALKKVESDYANYIAKEFLPIDGNEFWVFEDNNVWVCALRLYKVGDKIYYIEALETHPDYRRKGYAKKLLDGVIDYLKSQGHFKLCDSVYKNNEASVKTHLKCGFKIVSDHYYTHNVRFVYSDSIRHV